MRNIDRFILHVVHNWTNKFNEAMNSAQIDSYVKYFQKEADDLNITITDNELKSHIENFERFKGKLPPNQRDLGQWTLTKLIKFSTTSSGKEVEDEPDLTPDVVYHNDDNSIIIWNGAKEENCITYGRGEKWCIASRSWAGHRYSEDKKFPTFYLAKNNNLPDSNKYSFIVIAVLDPKLTYSDKNYVLHPRDNSPYYPPPGTFEKLLSDAPWLKEIPNLKSIIKYIPLTSKEKLGMVSSNRSSKYREWTILPFSFKKQYLVNRGNKGKLFSDIEDKEFITKYLPKYPEIATFIAKTPGILPSSLLAATLDNFSDADRKSITANMHPEYYLNTALLPEDNISFDTKKLLVKLGKWKLEPNERLYVTKDGETIVKLKLDDDIKIGLYKEDEDYPSIKINQRTIKYLLEYPEIDKIPLSSLSKLSEQGLISGNFILQVVNNAKESKDSALIVKQTDEGEFILDSNTFSSYKLDKDNKISKISFDNEEIQKALADSKDNESLQQNAFNLFYESYKENENLPKGLDINALKSIIKLISYDKRKIDLPGGQAPLILFTSNKENRPFFTMTDMANSDIAGLVRKKYYYTSTSGWDSRGNRERYNEEITSPEDMASFTAYLRNENAALKDTELKSMMMSSDNTGESVYLAKKLFIENNPPLDSANIYVPVSIPDGEVGLINTRTPSDSIKLSTRSGKALSWALTPSKAARLRGVTSTTAGTSTQSDTETPTPSQDAPRRGRPVGSTNTARQQARNEPPREGEARLSDVASSAGLLSGFNSINYRTLRRMPSTLRPVAVMNNRGASRRQNTLGNRGQVVRAYEGLDTDIYIIRLPNGNFIASVVAPGNSHWIVTSNNSYQIDSPRDLLNALQQRGLAEIHQYITNEYLERHPEHLTEFRQLLRQHINEKKKQNEQK